MVMERWQDDRPKLLQEKVVLVRVKELYRFDALKAGGDPGCLPLDEGGQDLVALFFLQMEEAGGGMLRDEFQGLEHKDSGFLGGKVWELLLDVPQGTGHRFRIYCKTDDGRRSWRIGSSRCDRSREGGTAPTILLVVPKMAEGGLMVDLCLVIDGWYPHKRYEVCAEVFVKGLKAPKTVGNHGKVLHWVGVGSFGLLGCVEPRSRVDHVVTAIGCLQATPTKIEGVGIIAVKNLWIHRHQEVFGELLLAILTLQFLGRVGVGHVVKVQHVLGEIRTGGHAQMVVGVRVEVLLGDGQGLPWSLVPVGD